MKRSTKLFLFISGIVIVGIIHLSYFSFYDKQLQQLQDHSIVNSESIKTSNKFFEEFKYVKPNFTVNVLFYAPVAGFMGAHILRPPPNCPMVNCTFTETYKSLSDYHGVVFHLPTWGSNTAPQKAFPEQTFIVYSMESEEIYRNMKDPTFMAQFDWKMSYRLDSEIVTPYFGANYQWWMTPPYPKGEMKATTAYVASNCGAANNRDQYVLELMKYLPVDSYGRCIHNKDWPPRNSSTSAGMQKFHTIKKYKFFLAFESHSAIDYVSEKVFHALASGTLPVYMGAPNIDQFLPSPKSIIRVTDYETPEDLAKYLKFLDENPEEYEKHLRWKREGPSQQFMDLIADQRLDAKCRLCIKLAEKITGQKVLLN